MASLPRRLRGLVKGSREVMVAIPLPPVPPAPARRDPWSLRRRCHLVMTAAANTKCPEFQAGASRRGELWERSPGRS